MDNQIKHILVKWYNTDTNVESAMVYEHVISIAEDTIDQLVKFNQERELFFQKQIQKMLLLIEQKEIVEEEHKKKKDKLNEENIGVEIYAP